MSIMTISTMFCIDYTERKPSVTPLVGPQSAPFVGKRARAEGSTCQTSEKAILPIKRKV